MIAARMSRVARPPRRRLPAAFDPPTRKVRTVSSDTPLSMQKLVSLCKRRGFVYQSSEIYGGLRSAYDYGPMGVELKRNLMDEWWRATVHRISKRRRSMPCHFWD